MGSFPPTFHVKAGTSSVGIKAMMRILMGGMFLTVCFIIMMAPKVSDCSILHPPASVLRSRRSPLSASDGEIISASRGFVGNPLYRPYGFGSWGWGSNGFGSHAFVTQSPFYGSYQYLYG